MASLQSLGQSPLLLTPDGDPLTITRTTSGPATFSFDLSNSMTLVFDDVGESDLSPTDGATLLAGIYIPPGSSPNGTIMLADSGSQEHMSMRWVDGKLECELIRFFGDIALSVRTEVPRSQWVTCACASDEEFLYVYRNGENRGNANHFLSEISPFLSISIGDDSAALPLSMTSVHFYGRYLDADEIASAHNAMVAAAGVLDTA